MPATTQQKDVVAWQASPVEVRAADAVNAARTAGADEPAQLEAARKAVYGDALAAGEALLLRYLRAVARTRSAAVADDMPLADLLDLVALVENPPSFLSWNSQRQRLERQIADLCG